MKRHGKKRFWWVMPLCGILLFFSAAYFLFLEPLLDQKVYSGEDFGIERVLSSHDENGNETDDYTDILLGARDYVGTSPVYKSVYHAEGYPPEGEGVCTDVIWKALEAAGYSLKDLVDEDIAANVESYPRTEGKPDPNIDFRRVPNLKVFLERNALSLTTDYHQIAQWQPGDIVVFSDSHIGIISDQRNRDGIPYLIHNGGQEDFEEDALLRVHRSKKISGHYRFPAE